LLKGIPKLLAWFLLSMAVFLASCSSMGDTAGPCKPPAAPESFLVRVDEGRLQIVWGNVQGATHYTVFWGTESGQYRGMGNSDTNSAFISGLTKGELYYIAVTSWNARGESKYSPEHTVVYDTNPERADTYLAKGNDAMKRGLTNEAHAYFCATIRLDPENADAYRSRSVLYEIVNWNELARKDYRTAEKLQKNPTISAEFPVSESVVTFIGSLRLPPPETCSWTKNQKSIN